MWVYTPRNRCGLSKKLAHNWHGPYCIVEFLSPVHCILRAVDNSRVSSTVHVTRLKRYIDPADRPSRQPLTDVDEPFLADGGLPPNSFATETEVLEPPSTPSTPDKSDDDEPVRTDDNVYQAERILRHRMRNRKPQFLVKWAGFPESHNTWEPRENLLDKRLLKRYFQDHPRASRLLEDDPDFHPRVASLSWTIGNNTPPVVAVMFSDSQHILPGSHFYLATDRTTIPIHHGNGTSLLSVKPLHVYNFLCDYSFYSQSTGLAECAPHLSFQFAVFHNNKFHFVSWQTLPLQNGLYLSDANFQIPQPLVIDNGTLQSLDDTYRHTRPGLHSPTSNLKQDY